MKSLLFTSWLHGLVALLLLSSSRRPYRRDLLSWRGGRLLYGWIIWLKECYLTEPEIRRFCSWRRRPLFCDSRRHERRKEQLLQRQVSEESSRQRIIETNGRVKEEQSLIDQQREWRNIGNRWGEEQETEGQFINNQQRAWREVEHDDTARSSREQRSDWGYSIVNTVARSASTSLASAMTKFFFERSLLTGSPPCTNLSVDFRHSASFSTIETLPLSLQSNFAMLKWLLASKSVGKQHAGPDSAWRQFDQIPRRPLQ
jgi:hypothetical protein